MGSTMALNWAQRRYFVSSTGGCFQSKRIRKAPRKSCFEAIAENKMLEMAGELDGVLHMRLTPSEGRIAAELLQSDEPLRLGAM